MSEPTPLPDRYRRTLRILLRYALVMAIVGLLIGISFQESAKKLTWEDAASVHLEAILPLGLVHGHVFVLGVLLPLAVAGMLLLARRLGGAEVGPWTHRGATLLLLPFIALTLGLQLYKGYHWLLHARAGARDLAAIDHAYFGGAEVVRYGVYGLVHGGFGLGLVLVVVGVWRSLRVAPS